MITVCCAIAATVALGVGIWLDIRPLRRPRLGISRRETGL